jgi:hypothetical protein
LEGLSGFYLYFHSWDDVLDSVSLLTQPIRRSFLSLSAIFCWFVWQEHNRRVFKGTTGTRAMVLFRQVLSYFQFYIGSPSGLDHLYREEVVEISDDSDEDLLDG